MFFIIGHQHGFTSLGLQGVIVHEVVAGADCDETAVK